jgi:hypothetical protein
VRINHLVQYFQISLQDPNLLDPSNTIPSLGILQTLYACELNAADTDNDIPYYISSPNSLRTTYLGTGSPLPILFRPALGVGSPVCAPLCRRANGGAPIDPRLVAGLVTLCGVSEWNDEEDVLRVGEAGLAGPGIPDCLLGADIPDCLRSLGVGIPDNRRPVADSGRLKGVVRPSLSSCEIERMDKRESGRDVVEGFEEIVR